MKSTWVMPASIIRSSAFSPAPPTPTTRITARYEALSRGRSRRAGFSGSGSSQRATGGPSSCEASAGARAGSSSGTTERISVWAVSSGFRPRPPPRPLRSWAASVARKSSASGPSRMLTRFLAIEHLLGQVSVERRRLAVGLVGDDRGAPDGRLGVADRLPDPGVEDELAEVLAQDLVGLARVGDPPVVHGREDPDDVHVRIEVLAHHLQSVLELD